MSLFLQQKPLLSPAGDAVATFVASLRALSDARAAEATAALAEFGDEERRRALGGTAKVAVFVGKMGIFRVSQWGMVGKMEILG